MPYFHIPIGETGPAEARAAKATEPSGDIQEGVSGRTVSAAAADGNRIF
jgi:hypothetical protein